MWGFSEEETGAQSILSPLDTSEKPGFWEGREQACCKLFQLLSTEVKHLSDSAWVYGALGRVSTSLAQCLPLLPVLLGAIPLSCHTSVGASPSSPNHPSPLTLIPNATTCTRGYSHLAFHIMESCNCVWLLSLSIMVFFCFLFFF